ncbi:MAG: ribosome maturation factor RimP [Burkholderiales bacterium]|nr:ribosome maturation factor RimP [Burkholderiales bacterium]
MDPRRSVAATVEGLGYELVDLERAPRGLMRVTIDRRAGHAYAEPGAAVTVGDCEQVTRQLQYALEVDGVDYARLEVSSPGLDRPLHHGADYARFVGARVRLTLREPLAGRKHFEGILGAGTGGGWQLVFEDGKAEQVLGFTLDEVREARLVPVLDFKGRRTVDAGRADVATEEEAAAPQVPLAAVNQEVSR